MEIQPTHGKHPLLDPPADQVHDGRTPLGILGRRHDPIGLVEKDIPQSGGGLDPLAVDLDGVLDAVRPLTQLRDPPVDGDAAFPDERLRIPARAHPRLGDYLLKLLTRH